MWKRRKDKEEDQAPSFAPSAPGMAPATEPARPPQPAAPPMPKVVRPEANIGKTVVIKGEVYSQEDLYLDGQVEGAIELPGNRLTVGKSGKVHAGIKAREVDVHGTVHGNITAGEKITIRSAANLVGDLRSATISIEDGAYFKGSIDIVRPPAQKPAPAPQPPVSQPPAPRPPERHSPAPPNKPQVP